MFYLFNLVIIGLVLLIAYWWANQGLFSGILHLIAVIAAGAIALGLWEPLTTGVLLRGTPFDDYAWGVSLVLLFSVSLLVIRVALDKLVPGNVDLPHWANMVFGLPVGLASGILTMGIFVTGAGFLQSSQEIAGYFGWWRSPRTGQIEKHPDAMWLPVHQLTYQFYATLSVGSLRTGSPLKQYNPDLHVQSALVRNSYKKGQAKLALRPSDAEVRQLLQCQDAPRFIVQMHFKPGAQDFGEQLTLSNAQIRLIGAASGSAEAPVVFPDHWSQSTAQGPGRFGFDDISHFITSVPGQQSTDTSIEFSTPAGFVPRFIQVRNTRYALPKPVATLCGQGGPAASTGVDPGAVAQVQTGQSIQAVIAVDRRCRPINASTNKLPPGIKVVDQLLSEGEGTFAKGRGRISRGLRVEGFFAPKGTQVVQVEVTRNGPVDFYGALKDRAEPGAKIALIDSVGNSYAPIGYMHIKKDDIDVKLDPRNLVDTVDQMPVLPASGTQTLKLIFTITDGVEVVGMRWGDVTVGSCSLPIVGRN